MSPAELIACLDQHLQQQLGHQTPATLTHQLAQELYAAMLDWQAPELPASQNVTAIIACSFGFELLANGHIRAGAMNAQLAELVIELHRRHRCLAYMQWEIAEAVGARIPAMYQRVIAPDKAPHLSVQPYLSTQGVMNKIAQQASPCALGTVLVVAWRHHITRAVRCAREKGFHAFSPPLTQLPCRYQADSGQIWTRNAHNYLRHDILTRLRQQFATDTPIKPRLKAGRG